MVLLDKRTKKYLLFQIVSFAIEVLGIFVKLDVLILVLFFLKMVWIAYYEKDVFLKYLIFEIMSVWCIICVFAIDNFSLYIPNLLQYSSYAGALAPLVLVEEVFFLSILLLEKNKQTKKYRASYTNDLRKIENHNFKYMSLVYKLLIFVAIICVILFLIDAFKNNYYISGYTNRFDYQNNTTLMSSSFFGYLPYFIPFFAMYSNKKIDRKWMFVFVVLYALYLVLIGQKFTPFFQLICLLILYYGIPFRYNYLKENYKKILFIFLIGGLIFVIFSGMQMIFEKGDILLGLTQLYNRLVGGQGDIWWGIYKKFNGTGLHINEISDELTAFSRYSTDQMNYNFGIYKMMKLIAPSVVIQSYAAKGARFTMSTNSTVYYYFGLGGLIIFKIFTAKIIWLITNKIVVMSINKKPINVFFWSNMWYFMLSVMFMSEFYVFFSRTAMMICFIAFNLFIFEYLNEKHRRILRR